MKTISCLLTITCFVLVSFSQTKIVELEQLRLTYVQNVNSARQQIISSQTDVDRANVEVVAAQRELKRIGELVEGGMVSKIEFDQARDRVANAEVSLRTAKANLETRKLALNESLIALNRIITEIDNEKNKSFSSKPQNKTQQKPKVIKKPKHDSAVKTTLPLNVFEKPTIKKPSQPCTLNKSPELRSLQIGMKLKEVISVYPNFVINISEPPYLYEGSIKQQSLDDERMKGIKSLYLRFIRNTLSSIDVFYLPEVEWDSIEEFSENISDSLNLPKNAWMYSIYKNISNNEGKMSCNGFEVVTSLVGKDDYAINMAVPNFDRKVAQERLSDIKKLEDAERLEQAKKKKIFKP